VGEAAAGGAGLDELPLKMRQSTICGAEPGSLKVRPAQTDKASLSRSLWIVERAMTPPWWHAFDQHRQRAW